MPITIDGAGTISGLSTGGLPNGSVVQADLASGVAGTGPAFFAQTSSGTTFTAAVWTKVALQSEVFDTANCFNNTTYRFTPDVSGYYQFNGYLQFAVTLTSMQLQFYKNGSAFGLPLQLGSASGGYISNIIYMNGTTDYIELYGISGSTQVCAGAFTGALVRAL